MKNHLIYLLKTKVLYIFIVCLLIWFFHQAMSVSEAFRHFYLFGFYPGFSRFWRLLTGWIPFSIGDIIYTVVAVWLVIGLIHFIKYIFRWRKYPFAWLKTLLRFMLIMVAAYGIFLIFWGANYRYERLYMTTGLHGIKYNEEELIQLCKVLSSRLNQVHYQLAASDTLPIKNYLSFSEIKEKVSANYDRISKKRPYLTYIHPSLKPSMFGYIMNYAGITGYFNPFTGEGQVNTTPMPAGLPFTGCHEVAHQLGYAAENSANLIGYLVAATSPNPYFQYSANFVMFLYAINVMSFTRPKEANQLWKTLITPGVKKDYDAYFAFYDRFQTRLKPVLNSAYDQYLRANEQERGIRSYDDVVSLLLDYYRRNGELP